MTPSEMGAGQAVPGWRRRLGGGGPGAVRCGGPQGERREDSEEGRGEAFFDPCSTEAELSAIYHGKNTRQWTSQGEGADRSCGTVPVPLQQVFGRRGDQPGPESSRTALRVQVEDVHLDAEGAPSRTPGVRPPRHVGGGPEVADAAVRETSCSDVGPPKVGQAAVQRSSTGPLDAWGPRA